MSSFVTAFQQGFNSIGYHIKRKSPEILMTCGIGAVVWASVDACKRTLKMPEIIERHENCLEEIKTHTNEDGETVDTTKGTITVAEATTQVQAHFCIEAAKLYALPVTVGALGIGMIVGSHCILSNRYTKAVSAYVALSETFKGYRQRTKDRVGAEIERKIRYGITDEETEEEVVNEKGKKKTVKKTVEVVDPETMMDDFTAFFTSFTTNEWSGSMLTNRTKINQVAKWATERLEREKRLFINDVLRDLGLPTRASGQFVGWVYDEKNPIGDNYVNINIEESTFKNPKTGQLEPGFILEFNADGNVIEKAF